MSLYGDLPQAKDGGDAGHSWAAAAKKLQPAFRKPASVLAPPPSLLRAGRGGGRTPTSGGRGGARGPPPSLVNPDHPALAPAGGSEGLLGGGGPIIVSSLSFFSVNGEPIKDEYDPSRPNDYERIRDDREKKRQAAEEEAGRQAKLREIEQELERRRKEQAEAAALVLAAAKPPPGAPQPEAQALDPDEEALHAFGGQQGLGAAADGGGAAGDPSHSGVPEMSEQERQRRAALSGEEVFLARQRMSGEEAFAARQRMSRGGGAPGSSRGDAFAMPGHPPSSAAAAAAAGAGPGPLDGGAKGMTLAQKMLEKMGWREGDGLGRNRQGISAPLVAQKTAQHAAVIVQASEPEPKRPKLQGATFSGTPTRVVALRNMVGPGEVDEDLEEEVGTELTKYGKVEDVLIFEVTTPGYAPEEAVRIFIKFERAEAATRALVDLQGRFFGGRQVRAAFFSEERFASQKLAPEPGEFGEQ